jgi:VanZ family protein
LWWAAAVLWAIGIFAASSQEGAPNRFTWLDLPFRDKLAHAGVFAVLAMLVTKASDRWLFALIIVSLYGISDELHQAGVPGRTADPYDWLADTLGASLGSALVGFLTHRHRQQKNRLQ